MKHYCETHVFPILSALECTLCGNFQEKTSQSLQPEKFRFFQYLIMSKFNSQLFQGFMCELRSGQLISGIETKRTIIHR